MRGPGTGAGRRMVWRLGDPSVRAFVQSTGPRAPKQWSIKLWTRLNGSGEQDGLAKLELRRLALKIHRLLRAAVCKKQYRNQDTLYPILMTLSQRKAAFSDASTESAEYPLHPICTQPVDQRVTLGSICYAQAQKRHWFLFIANHRSGPSHY
jgi:hypothetical protein